MVNNIIPIGWSIGLAGGHFDQWGFGNQSWNDIPQITTGIFSSSFASVFDSTFISEFHRLTETKSQIRDQNDVGDVDVGDKNDEGATGNPVFHQNTIPVQKNRPHSTNRPLSPRLHLVAKNEQSVQLTMWKY